MDALSGDVAGVVSGETDIGEAGRVLLGEKVSDWPFSLRLGRSRRSWEWAVSCPDSSESWARSRRLLAAPPVRGCWAGALMLSTSSGEEDGKELC